MVERLSSTRILKNDNTAFCRNIGIPVGAGGLYVKPSSTILVLYSKFPDDIVIVHELLHLVSRMLGGEGSTIVEEDFAYGQSLPYVLGRGDRDWVLHKYLMPYYVGYVIKKKKLDSASAKGMREAKKLAEEHCNRMIEAALGIMPTPSMSNDLLDGFDYLM
jgi:hypothetical protein